MYGETKREMRNRALCYRKELRTISLYIYIYIYREREREGNKKRERRGEKEAPPHIFTCCELGSLGLS
jgi:hypothetical protein